GGLARDSLPQTTRSRAAPQTRTSAQNDFYIGPRRRKKRWKRSIQRRGMESSFYSIITPKFAPTILRSYCIQATALSRRPGSLRLSSSAEYPPDGCGWHLFG